jgi:hypothetical protein
MLLQHHKTSGPKTRAAMPVPDKSIPLAEKIR